MNNWRLFNKWNHGRGTGQQRAAAIGGANATVAESALNCLDKLPGRFTALPACRVEGDMVSTCSCPAFLDPDSSADGPRSQKISWEHLLLSYVRLCGIDPSQGHNP